MASLLKFSRILRSSAWARAWGAHNSNQSLLAEKGEKCKQLGAFADVAGNPFMHADFETHSNEGMECGRGDKRTKRGKIFRDSYGKTRPSTKKLLRRLRIKWEIPKGMPLPGPYDIA